MKTISVIAIFTAEVPEDMDINKINELCEKEIRNDFDNFRIHVHDYHDEDENEPWFELQKVSAATSYSLQINKQ